MAARGLGYEALAARNPALVYTSITAFGQDGPKAGWAYSDLTLIAAGGQMILNGDDDRPPVRVGFDQAFLHAAAEAAGGALIALYERQQSGRGQHVDVSAQQAVLQCTQSFCLAYPLHAPETRRSGGGAKFGPLKLKLVYRCADGHVSLTLLFGTSVGPFTRRLMEWICEEGGCDEATRDKDWIQYGMLLHTGEEPLSEWERVTQIVADFVAPRTKAELLEAALARKLLIAPFATIEEVAESAQFKEREFWEDLEHPELGRHIRYPGTFSRYSATPLQPVGRAPQLGAHTDAVLAWPPRTPAVPATLTSDGNRLPLQDIKVLDLMWAMAGPAYSRVLADFGATIVRVESESAIEVARTIQPFMNDEPGPDNSGLFANMNAGKLGMTLDLRRPEAREVFCDLVRWADVLVESFSPKAMRSWGLGYEDLRTINPGLIMVSSCLMGQSGPLSLYAGFGTAAAAICGYSNIVGWPDRDPSGPFSAYTDYVSPRFTLIALMAALEHRRATGEGQYIDFSQAEASMQFMAPLMLDYTVNGRVFERRGNRDDRYCPHAVYPATGEDRWVAIACTTDEHWRSLCEEMGRPDLAADASLSTAAGRRDREAELDELIGAWTAGQDALDVQARLQARRVPCHEAANSSQSYADPQLQHRGHFVHAEHSLHGTFCVEGPRARLSRTPGVVRRAGPTMGEHLFEVLTEHLGYDVDKAADIIATGALA
jgi:crotonobetainyl-CoA:carnitine CoA-transferase CaiB-like acyl-CoA transferase